MKGEANTNGDGAAPGPVTVDLRLSVNGRRHPITVDTRETLLDTLRERMDLTGTKKGCDHGQCGACTVLVGGRRVKSCLTLTVTVDDRDITTVEGLSADGVPHPLQAAFIENDALQCGYCTPGQLCSAVGMLAEVADGWPSAVTPGLDGEVDLSKLADEEIRERMSGNLCRCGAYPGIVAAIGQVAR
ncbi:(2Fe-2S)-binding protein [Sphaerisporangium corydalis]|uniref:(2Fe-2S)-binding protein n=1 Tax=Sphaerisporangium corydalis TaxID=1441875 RepID=A0ABV9EGM0_9ACTN|nr:2Fe-2S iron-sulfur cluster-binding protein [Sphaerisporangium corydalis]